MKNEYNRHFESNGFFRQGCSKYFFVIATSIGVLGGLVGLLLGFGLSAIIDQYLFQLHRCLL
jgi:ABC-type antimicrobial peptide transport system permease subunit